jgi:hypothetical protein
MSFSFVVVTNVTTGRQGADRNVADLLHEIQQVHRKEPEADTRPLFQIGELRLCEVGVGADEVEEEIDILCHGSSRRSRRSGSLVGKRLGCGMTTVMKACES